MPTPTGDGKPGVGEQPDQVVAGARGGDPVEIGAEHGGAARLDAGLVHPARIHGGDLAADRIGAAIGGLDDVAQLRLDILAQHGADAPGGAVGRDRVGLEPAVVGVAPEIVAGLDRRIAGGEVDAPAARSATGGGRGRWRRRRAAARSARGAARRRRAAAPPASAKRGLVMKKSLQAARPRHRAAPMKCPRAQPFRHGRDSRKPFFDEALDRSCEIEGEAQAGDPIALRGGTVRSLRSPHQISTTPGPGHWRPCALRWRRRPASIRRARRALRLAVGGSDSEPSRRSPLRRAGASLPVLIAGALDLTEVPSSGRRIASTCVNGRIFAGNGGAKSRFRRTCDART